MKPWPMALIAISAIASIVAVRKMLAARQAKIRQAQIDEHGGYLTDDGRTLNQVMSERDKSDDGVHPIIVIGAHMAPYNRFHNRPLLVQVTEFFGPQSIQRGRGASDTAMVVEVAKTWYRPQTPCWPCYVVGPTRLHSHTVLGYRMGDGSYHKGFLDGDGLRTLQTAALRTV